MDRIMGTGIGKYKVVSLFSGCGGLDLGFNGNFTINAEILKGKYPDMLCHKMPKKADIVLGGFPCQDFSVAGKRKGFDGTRGIIYRSMVETVKRLRPALFVAENVRGLLSMDNGEAINTIVKDFADLGYTVVYKLHHAADFGVPQNRERVIIVGTDKTLGLPEFEYPMPTHTKENWVTLKHAISDLKDKKEGAVSNHYWSKAKMFAGTQGNSTVNPDGIAPTMRAEHHGNIEWHWNRQRRLSAREAARIQTFPDDVTSELFDMVDEMAGLSGIKKAVDAAKNV